MKEFLKNLSDEDIVFVIQHEYNQYRRMFKWECTKCERVYSFDSLVLQNHGFQEVFYCKSCRSLMAINNNLPDYEFYKRGFDNGFKSIFLEELDRRYLRRLKKDCSTLDDKQDVFGELWYVYFKAIMNYRQGKKETKSKFNTYFWQSVKKRHVDIDRRKGWISKNPTITCQICGHPVGKVTKTHLINFSDKFSKGVSEEYIGHKKFHDQIMNFYGFKRKGKTDLEIKKFLGSKVLPEYTHMFPAAPMEATHISLDGEMYSNKSDDDFTLLDALQSEEVEIFEEDDILVYRTYLFPSDYSNILKKEYPLLYSLYVKDKRIQKISKTYANHEDKDIMHKLLNDLAVNIIQEYCSSDEGISRKNKFYDLEGNLDYHMIDIVSEVIELGILNEYEDEAICSVLGHDNVNKNEVKLWLGMILENKECQKIMQQYMDYGDI